jgi:hypothetical protein
LARGRSALVVILPVKSPKFKLIVVACHETSLL